MREASDKEVPGPIGRLSCLAPGTQALVLPGREEPGEHKMADALPDAAAAWQ